MSKSVSPLFIAEIFSENQYKGESLKILPWSYDIPSSNDLQVCFTNQEFVVKNL